MNITQKIKQIKPLRDFNDHTYISLRNKYFFHTVGKAANSSLKNIFYQLELLGTHYHVPVVHDRLQSPHLSPFQVDETLLSDIMFGKNFYRFTFVRHPFARLLSCYLDRIRNTRSRPYRDLIKFMGKEVGYAPTFEEYIRNICEQDVYMQNNHWRIQYYDAMCPVVHYDYIGKQENFLNDVKNIFRSIGNDKENKINFEVFSSPNLNNSSQKIDEYWTNDLKKIVLNKYEKDFSFFSYDKEFRSEEVKI